jgi:hypothetical protein
MFETSALSRRLEGKNSFQGPFFSIFAKDTWYPMRLLEPSL